VTASILCIDDEPAVGVILEHTLTRAGHRPMLVTSVDEAMRVVARTPVDLVIADYRMPGLTGLDLLAQLQKERYKIPVIIMTGYSSIEHAVASIKAGAIDYLTKPIQAETLEIAVRQALEVARLRRENETFRREIVKIRGRRALIGDSEAFRHAMEVVSTVATSRATVLLHGESGTGKELFARAIHAQSPRADEPFITVNCAALPEGLVESALFGHERGAFTGATARSAGAFERAHGGPQIVHTSTYYREADDIGTEPRKEVTTALMAVLGLGGGGRGWVLPDPEGLEAATLEAVKLLVGLGVDVNAANANGRTALDAATALRFDSVVEFLDQNGANSGAPPPAADRSSQ
jgi:DNA-binding response OmpR family regulator